MTEDFLQTSSNILWCFAVLVCVGEVAAVQLTGLHRFRANPVTDGPLPCGSETSQVTVFAQQCLGVILHGEGHTNALLSMFGSTHVFG